MRPFLITALLITAAPALADDTTGEILAFDRVANIIVLDDKTVWPLGATKAPDDLMAGERVKITFTSAGETGVTGVSEVVRAAN